MRISEYSVQAHSALFAFSMKTVSRGLESHREVLGMVPGTYGDLNLGGAAIQAPIQIGVNYMFLTCSYLVSTRTTSVLLARTINSSMEVVGSFL